MADLHAIETAAAPKCTRSEIGRVKHLKVMTKTAIEIGARSRQAADQCTGQLLLPAVLYPLPYSANWRFQVFVAACGVRAQRQSHRFRSHDGGSLTPRRLIKSRSFGSRKSAVMLDGGLRVRHGAEVVHEWMQLASGMQLRPTDG